MLLKNLSKQLDDPRHRNTIIITVLLLLTMVLIGTTKLFRQVRGKNLPSTVKIQSTPPINSVPGGLNRPASPSYIKLQMEQNKKLAEQAKKTGRSAIATIVDGFDITASSQKPKNHYSQTSPLMSEAEQAIINHNAFISQQQTELTKQQIQGAMHQQISQLFNTWNHVPLQQYQTNETHVFSDKETEQKLPALIKAGTVLHAVLLTEVNSDEPTPVLAQITTGDFKEGRLIGTLSRVGERLLVNFHTLNISNTRKALSISAFAVDAATTKTSLASHVDRHLLLRYGSLFGAAFLQGYGTAFQNRGNQIIQNHSTEATLNNVLSPTGKLLSAIGNVGSHFSGELAHLINTPPTVCVHAGTSIGILFTADLVDTASML